MTGSAPRDSEARRLYLHLREVFGDPALRGRDARRRSARRREPSQPFDTGRDPRGLGDVFAGLTRERGWTSTLERSEVMTSWPEIAGPDVAQHSTPRSFDDGVLVVACDSTAWASQLRSMRVAILTTIIQRYPEAGVQEVRFLGPGAPSWKRGPKSVPGRGPRDTYG